MNTTAYIIGWIAVIWFWSAVFYGFMKEIK